MKNKKSLLFILILFLIIFSTSFVSASDDLTHTDTNGDTLLSMDQSVVDENSLNEINLDSTKQSSDSTSGLVDDARNTNEYENDGCLTYVNEAPILGASNDEPVLGTDQNVYGGTPQDIIDAMVRCSNSNGGTVYLNNQTYRASDWGQLGRLTAGQNQMIDIRNVRIVGGTPANPNLMSTIEVPNDNTALTFKGYSTGIPGTSLPWNPSEQRPGYYSNSGVRFTNVAFENLYCNERLFEFDSGALTNCVFNNLISREHLMFIYGAYWDNTPIPLTNCNFTNCHQTYEGVDPMAGNDGTGQLGVLCGGKLVGCNFINTSSATHGGAFCLSDESNACYAPSL